MLEIFIYMDVNFTCRDIKPIQEQIGFDKHITCCQLSGLTYRLMDRSSCIPAISYTANGGFFNGIATSVFDNGLRGVRNVCHLQHSRLDPLGASDNIPYPLGRPLWFQTACIGHLSAPVAVYTIYKLLKF